MRGELSKPPRRRPVRPAGTAAAAVDLGASAPRLPAWPALERRAQCGRARRRRRHRPSARAAAASSASRCAGSSSRSLQLVEICARAACAIAHRLGDIAEVAGVERALEVRRRGLGRRVADGRGAAAPAHRGLRAPMQCPHQGDEPQHREHHRRQRPRQDPALHAGHARCGRRPRRHRRSRSPARVAARRSCPTPGATCSDSAGSVAVRAAPARTSHQAMRGPSMRSVAGARRHDREAARDLVRGRPLAKVSSTCAGSANTCAPSPAANCSSGNCAALAPSATASTATVAASPARSVLRRGGVAQAQVVQRQPRLRRVGRARCAPAACAARRVALQRAAAVAEQVVEESAGAAPLEARAGNGQRAAAFGDQQEAALDHVVAAAADLARVLRVLADALQRRAFGRGLVELPGDQRHGVIQPHDAAHGLLHVRIVVVGFAFDEDDRRRRASGALLAGVTVSVSGCVRLVADAQRGNRRSRRRAAAAARRHTACALRLRPLTDLDTGGCWRGR